MSYNIQTASEHNISWGKATVMGTVDGSTNKPLWALPGGRYTANRGRAMEVAKLMDRLINQNP